jgi:glycosyltransferase involved in cell wall biosynthesis
MKSDAKRILMVLDHSFPEDVRVENEARTLIEAGFAVSLLAIGPDVRPEMEDYRGIQIFRNKLPAALRNKLRGLAGTIQAYSLYLEHRIRGLHRTHPFDAIHVHDLYLFGGGLRAARRLRLPVVGDLHENWVEALRGYEWSNRFPARLLISYRKWERLEKRWTQEVDRLVVVIEEAAERNVTNGVAEDRLVLVPNTLAIDHFESLSAGARYDRSDDGLIHLTYAGGIDRHRGLQTVVDAMPAIIKANPAVRLQLAGDGRTRNALESRCGELGLGDYVVFHGWQPLEEVKSLIESADICLIPHLRTPHTDATIPHKLFQYMYCSRPVLTSDCRPLARIVRETGCGSVFEAGNSASLAAQAIDLLARPDDWSALGKKGREAVIRKYNWKTTSRALVDAYEGLFSSSALPATMSRRDNV